jgi:tRNA A37 threonylcarbamoyladenosine modification protein TsaB
LPNSKLKVDILVIALSSPLLIGVYSDKRLINSITREGKSSDLFATLFEDILDEYDVTGLYYANGPGSFMSIKMGYVFLSALSIAKDIPLFATDAFAFNNNTPIKAIGKNHYIKENNAIIMKMIGDSVKSEAFALPQKLESGAFNMNHQPLYIAPAV